MPELVLESLLCRETEDWGADECRLGVIVDGQLSPYLRRTMSNGERWQIGRRYPFQQTVQLKLHDEDWPDPDDDLGSNTIGNGLVDRGRVRFQRDGANYELIYSVLAVLAPAVDDGAATLAQFSASSQPGVWPQIAKTDLVREIQERLAQPYRVKQGPSPLCGPAAIVFELVSRRKSEYVRLCRELFETGKFRALTKDVAASERLRGSRVRSDMAAADWMLLATLRESENAVFNVDANSGDIALGISTPSEMKTWTREILRYSVADYDSTTLYGEFDAMRKAKRIRNAGGVAFPMVHTALVDGTSPPPVNYPNHWISYVGGLSIDDGLWYRWDDGRIKFDCYSWGEQPRHVNASEGKFEDTFFGAVFGSN